MDVSKLRLNLTYIKFYIKGLYYLSKKDKWKTMQKKELVKILRYGIEHSAYLRDNVGRIDIDESNVVSILKRFPTITKQTIVDNS